VNVNDEPLDDCGCCAGTTTATEAPTNRPGLSAIAYRVGTYADFKQAMQAALSDADRPALAPLTTRDTDDFALALLDAWAMVADVLTFYQERIANESYLRTATELRSVLELARAIGYELRPGVAANAYLAFTLEDAAGAPGYATIVAGTKVQSVPGPDEKPQTFETVEALDARAAWNSLVPQQTQLVFPDNGAADIFLKGVNTNLRPGDGLLLFDGAGRWDFRRVERLDVDHDRVVTQVTWAAVLGWRPLTAALQAALVQKGITGFHIYALRQRAALFGSNAPDWRAMSPDVRKHYLGPDDADTGVEWPHLTLADIDAPAVTAAGTGLQGDYYDGTDFNTFKFRRIDTSINFDWTATPPDPTLGLTNYSVRWQGQYRPAVSGTYVIETTSDDGVRLWLNGQRLINNWTTHGATVDQATVVLNAGQMYALTLEYFQGPGAAVIQLRAALSGQTTVVIPQGQLYPPAAAPAAQRIYLDAVYPSILSNTFLVLAAPDAEAVFLAANVTATSRSGFTLSAKTTRIAPTGGALLPFDNRVREAVVFAAPEELALAERPWTDPVQDDAILLDRVVNDLTPGRKLLVRGVLQQGSKTKTGELAVLKEAVAQDGHTLLKLDGKLGAAYDRATVTVAANVALSTNGESVSQVLGSGDAGAPYQRFALREAPLTYTTADSATGGATTLKIRINEIKWEEVLTLFGRGPHERVYVTRRDADGHTSVLFGDGRTGARIPSGRDNVLADYRKGIGSDGMVRAEQLSLLMTRALGVKGVVNPLPAEGAQDPQALGDARRNAPFTVLTLDRVVSLRDYEDFTRAFAGIAKAKAAWTWNGHARGVFLTVAGPDGAPLTSDGPTLTNLVSALHRAGNPRVPVRVASYRPAYFHLHATVQRDPAYLAERVRADVVTALQSRFGFEAREFGQALTLSEVVAAIQGVAGVAAVNVTRLYRTGAVAVAAGTTLSFVGLQAYLPADAPADGSADNGLLPAELLTVADDVASAVEVVP
jgi:hypothetical protein